MSFGRFGSKSGTHRAFLEQITSGEKLNYTIAFRRLKYSELIYNLLQLKIGQNRSPGTQNEAKWGPES